MYWRLLACICGFYWYFDFVKYIDTKKKHIYLASFKNSNASTTFTKIFILAKIMHIFTLAEKDSQIKSLVFDIAVRRVLVILISRYQKYLSPHKGFSCAHRVLHGGESCSCYVKCTILEQDLITAISMSQERFRACSSANRVLKAINSNLVADEINAATAGKGNQKGKAELFRRRKFIQGMILGFTMPLLFGARGNCNCCGNLCLETFFESEEERNKKEQ